MQLPAFPSETDPRFQEMLSKALSLPGDAPAKPATDTALDVEACKREMREAMEWAARNRDKWAGPRAARAAMSAASTVTEQHAKHPPAKPRPMFAAHRHRGSRRRPHRRVRLPSRAGPLDGPAPDEPDAPSTPDTTQGGVP